MRKVREPAGHAELLDGQGHLATVDHVRVRGEDQRRVQRDRQHERDGQVARDERRRHAHRQHRRAEEPVAEIVRRDQPDVRHAQTDEDGDVGQRETQCDREDRQRRQVLADDDVDITRRQRQQEFVGAALPFLGPDAHRHGGDERQHDPGDTPVELIEVGEVGVEELVRPEGGEGGHEHQGADEHVADRAAEVAHEVPFEDGDDDVGTHGIQAVAVVSSAKQVSRVRPPA